MCRVKRQRLLTWRDKKSLWVLKWRPKHKYLRTKRASNVVFWIPSRGVFVAGHTCNCYVSRYGSHPFTPGTSSTPPSCTISVPQSPPPPLPPAATDCLGSWKLATQAHRRIPDIIDDGLRRGRTPLFAPHTHPCPECPLPRGLTHRPSTRLEKHVTPGHTRGIVLSCLFSHAWKAIFRPKMGQRR